MLRYVRASAEDQAKVEEFLHRMQDDRLIKQLGKLLSLTQGGLYLAIDDNDAIVGTAVLTLPKRHEAYLGQVRLASPNLDRETLTSFAAFQLEEAQKLGAHIVRAMAGDDSYLSCHPKTAAPNRFSIVPCFPHTYFTGFFWPLFSTRGAKDKMPLH